MSSSNTRGTREYNLRNKDQNRDGHLQSTSPCLVEDDPQANSGPTQLSTQPGMDNSPGGTHQRPGHPSVPQSCLDPNASILSEMRKMFADFKSDLNKKLDRVITDLDSVKNDIAEMKSKTQELELSVADTSARISTVETDKIPGIEGRLKKMQTEFEDKLMLHELHNRKQNLLFYGIPSQPNENVYKQAAGAFSKILEIPMEDASSIPLVNAHRLPTKKPPSDGANHARNPPDPIIVRFVRMSDRDRVLQAFEQPPHPRSRNTSGNASADTRITVRTDLPPPMKRERGRLASIAYQLRKTKQMKTKIVIHGTKVMLKTRNQSEPTSNWAIWHD